MMSSRNLATTIMITTCAVLLALSCRAAHAGYADDRVIARVGDEVVTAREIIDASERVYLDAPTGDPATDRRRLIEPLIQAKLMVAEARARGLETPALLRRVERFRNDFLVNELERVEYREKVFVDPEEIDRAATLMEHILHLRHILVDDRAGAEQVLAELRAGADFDSLARAVSIDSTSASHGGQLPPMSWGSAEAGFIGLAYSLEPGVYGGPVQSSMGWHVVVQDSVTQRGGDPDALREQAERSLRQGADNRAQIAFLERLMDELHYTVQDSVVTLFASQMQRWVDAGHPNLIGVGASVNPLGFTAEMLEQVMFTYGGQAFTIGDFCGYMVGSPISMLSQRRHEDRVRKDLVQYFYRRACTEMALERGYLEASGYDREVRRQHEKALILELEAQAIILAAPPPESELRAHFDAHRDHYLAPARAMVTRIRVPAIPASELVLRGLQQGMAVDEAIRMGGSEIAGQSVIERRQQIEAGGADWPAVETLTAGEVTELESATAGERHLVLLDEQLPARRLSFEEARDTVAAEVKAAIEEQRYEQLIASLEATYPITVDMDALLELPLGS